MPNPSECPQCRPTPFCASSFTSIYLCLNWILQHGSMGIFDLLCVICLLLQVMQSQAWMLAKCRSQLYVHASIPISCQDWFWFSAKVSLTVCVGSSVTGRFRSFHLRVHVCRPTSERTRHWPFGCCPQLRFQDINTSSCQCAQSQRGFLRAYARMHHTKAGGFKFRRSAFRCEEPKAWCNCHKFGSSTFNRSLFLGALFFLRANKY